MKNMRKEVLMNLAGVILFYLMILIGLLAVCNRIIYVNGLEGTPSTSISY